MYEMNLSYHEPMFRIIEIRQYAREGSERAHASWAYVRRQPGWIARLALLTFFVILSIPVLILLFLAFLGAAIVFTVLAVANVVINLIRSIMPRRDGRENVRIVRRNESSSVS